MIVIYINYIIINDLSHLAVRALKIEHLSVLLTLSGLPKINDNSMLTLLTGLPFSQFV